MSKERGHNAFSTTSFAAITKRFNCLWNSVKGIAKPLNDFHPDSDDASKSSNSIITVNPRLLQNNLPSQCIVCLSNFSMTTTCVEVSDGGAIPGSAGYNAALLFFQT
uniref:Zf-RVT domain-containing protein n=1 Tax=Panagrellus redivivus TaxID=6233 RepID=A0A7E4ZYV8_PANRE